MQRQFPNSPQCFNILYMVSSAPPLGAPHIARAAKGIGAKLVWNQNGVAYPASRPDWKRRNRPMAKMLHLADHVFYQSGFCRMSADEFLGERAGSSEVLYNCVDTGAFTPAESDPDPDHLVILLGGTQYQYYRFETAVRALAVLCRQMPEARLLVAGALSWAADAEAQAHGLAQELSVSDRVTFLGSYTQQEAPGVFRQAHILLHTKYNDPCPGMVVEALASGLPVVYSRSGGVPELVGPDAGIGVPAELTWDRDIPPDPEALAQAILQVADRRSEFAQAARRRAVEKFDVQPWLDRHREVFEGLLC
jgi:glycosyltransferase involved in cell wall biosynthesis